MLWQGRKDRVANRLLTLTYASRIAQRKTFAPYPDRVLLLLSQFQMSSRWIATRRSHVTLSYLPKVRSLRSRRLAGCTIGTRACRVILSNGLLDWFAATGLR